MTQWINRTLVQAPRNGTSSHTVSFTAATAGNLLLCLADGAVTSSTPTGWTLPSGGSAVGNSGLYVWYKTATAAESSFSTTHNASNYPVGFVVYEFPAGSAFVASASATGIGSTSGPNPNLTGLTGTNLLLGVAGAVDWDTTACAATWTGTGSPVEDVDVCVIASGTDGYWLGMAYVESSTASSFQPTSTMGPQNGISREGLTLAVAVASGGLTVSPSGLASAGAFGTATVTKTLTVSPAGITSAEAFGTATVTKTLAVSPAGIASSETFGAASLTTALQLAPVGIASGEVFGAATAAAFLTTAPAGLPTGEAFGTVVISGVLAVSPAAIASGEAFGTAAISSSTPNVTVAPTGIPGEELFGTAVLGGVLELDPPGILSGEVFGVPALTLGALTVTVSGIPSGAALGTPDVHFVTTISPPGIPSGAVFGTAVLGGALGASHRVAAGRLPDRRYQASITSKRWEGSIG